MILGLKVKVQPQHKSSWSRIKIVVNTTVDFRIKPLVFGYHKNILTGRINPQVHFIAKHTTGVITDANIIHSQERSILNVIIRLVLVVEKIGIEYVRRAVAEDVVRIKDIPFHPEIGSNVVVIIITQIRPQNRAQAPFQVIQLCIETQHYLRKRRFVAILVLLIDHAVGIQVSVNTLVKACAASR